MDVRESRQKQVFQEKNLSLKSVHGSTLFNRPAGVIHSAPCIWHPYFQKANGKVFAKAVTSILRNLIYLSDAFPFFIEEKKCTKFCRKFRARGIGLYVFL